LGWPETDLRVIAPDVGGGFGPKAHVFPEEILTAFFARRFGCPIKWIEDRRENLAAAMHAKHQIVEAELALKNDGTILGVKARFLNDVGAYSCFPFSSALEAGHAASGLPGPYKLPAYRYEALSIVTNKVTLGAYRGVGLPIAILVMERLLNLGAQRLGLDPAEIRLRNMIRQEDHPYTTIAGAKIESGSHQESLQKALDMLGYDNFRAEQEHGRKAGRYLGVGLGCYIEGTAPGSSFFNLMGIQVGGYESATVRRDVNGTVTVLTGSSSHGQGHQTTLAQVAADELGVAVADVKVVQSDTALVPYGWGTWGSRTAVTSGGAIIGAATKIREKILRTASRLSEIPPDDLELAGGMVVRKQDGTTLMPIKTIAYHAIVAPSNLAPEDAPGLEATTNYEP
ncbi:MAG: molybdopterin-dependent oxidoreductase, partial [Gemmatimonadetes bacterium]|nr:molybdopterin-dependent oxidoreductase [Gemmatimonadota bacterium]